MDSLNYNESKINLKKQHLTYGCYQFLRMAFRLKNTTSTFQQITEFFFENTTKICLVYLDDITVFSTSL